MSDTEVKSTRAKVNKLSKSKNVHSLQHILPAPVPRSSYRIRTSSAETIEERPKRSGLSRKVQEIPSYSISNDIKKEGDVKTDSLFSNGFGTPGRVNAICSLANMGNTCFLNSVIYALRFLPGFVHDLHHLHTYINNSEIIKTNDTKSVDASSFGSLLKRVHFMNELHDLFVLLCKQEIGSVEGKRIPALHPLHFMDSLRSVNSTFDGNHQQDAHELVHCILDQLCFLPQDLHKEEESLTLHARLNPPKKRRRKALDTDDKKMDMVGSKFVGHMQLQNKCLECEHITSKNETFLEVCMPLKTNIPLHDSSDEISDDEDVPDTQVVLSALCKEESLLGINKYWCDLCLHHNEASRYIKYPHLPQHLLIHVKRFSSNSRTSTNKCCDSMPAPLRLSCFCQDCGYDVPNNNTKDQKSVITSHGITRWKDGEGWTMEKHQINSDKVMKNDQINGDKALGSDKINGDKALQSDKINGDKAMMKSDKMNGDIYLEDDKVDDKHLPYFLSAFVCHLGLTMSSGHYVSYVRVSPSEPQCTLGGLPTDKKEKGGVSKCSFINCCSAYVNRIGMSAPKPSINGPTKVKERDISDSIWLECDDDKIKVVTYAEVIGVLKSNLMTPYLLFYSR